MYYAHNNLGGFADALKKIRKKVHSIFPRELSPTRMIEKYQADQGKKTQAKLIATQQKQAAEIERIKAEAANIAPVSNAGQTSITPQAAPADNTMMYAGAAVLGLLAILALRKKR